MNPLRSVLLLTCTATLALASGCKRSTSSEAVSNDAGSSVVAKSGPDAAAATIDEASVRLLVDTWLEAQNSGSFATYEALYATRFEGIRRSGAQTAQLDRTRWMKERAAMFKQPTTVSAKDVVVRTTHGGATVSFIQTWASGSYRDEGPKLLVLTMEDGKLRIAREEMLSSTVLTSASLDAEKFAFALHLPEAHLVLEASPKNEWSQDAPAVVSMDDPVTTRKEIGTLPAEVAAWSGKRVELFGSSGVVCTGKIGTLSVIGRVVPHFGTKAHWTSTGDFEGHSKPPARVIAEEAWDLSSGHGESGRALVGVVRPETGDCKGALWGRVVQAEKPVMVAARPADAATKERALAELRKTKAYADLQRTYQAEKEPDGPPRWEDFDSKTTALVFDHPKGGTIVTLSIRAGAGCGTFGGTLSAAWQQKGERLVPVKDPSGEELAPVSAGDVDGDGNVDLLLDGQGLLRSKGGKLGAPRKLHVPMLDCGC